MSTPSQVAARMLAEYGERKFAMDMCDFHVSSAGSTVERDLYAAAKKVLASEASLVAVDPKSSTRGGCRPGAGRPRDKDQKIASTLRLTRREWRQVRKLIAELRAGA